MTPFTAVVMAAGRGTRMRSATPKVLHELCGRPLVAWPVEAARRAGARAVVVVVSPDVDVAGALPEDVAIAVQPQADGTGGALRAAAEHLPAGDPVVVLSGDVPLVTAEAIHGLVAAHLAAAPAATMATAVLDDPAGYGRVVRDGDGSVLRVAESKADGDATAAELEIREVNTGIFCFDAAALLDALPRLRADNAQGELYLPDVLGLMRADGLTVAAHEIEDPALVVGVNDRAALAAVRALAQRRIAEAHMLSGVTIVDPATTQIDATVTIGPDARIEPGTILRGATTVGDGATVGPHTTAIDSTLGPRSSVVHSHLVQAVVGAGASVGPFAYLRPGAVLGDAAKAGTFVEVKNSQIGARTKVPHLSYIGDADVGPDSNLGAGTITANYDGSAKHRTTIGARVRSAVDVAFVAPVTVGDDAWTAAGSVITDDVPDGALGVARQRQTNIEGYAKRKQEDQGQ